MAEPLMEVERYRPRREKQWDRANDGTVDATIYTKNGLVEVFTYPGGERGAAFTSLEMYIAPYVYDCILPRHYHERWLRRLAKHFAVKCSEMAKNR
jgi:hypothetical protein